MRVLVAILFILLNINLCTAGDKDLFHEVPSSERSKLIDRMKVLIQYEQTQQWERLYDLLYNPKENLREFIARKQKIRARIVSFDPIEVFYVEREGYWGIIGCAETTVPTGKHKRMEMSSNAKIKNGEWYFREIGIVIHHDHEDSCR